MESLAKEQMNIEQPDQKARFSVDIKRLAVALLTVFFMVGLPVLTLIASEVIVRGALEMPFLDWAKEFTKRFALNAILLIALFNIFYILPRKWFMISSLFVSSILLVFAIANKVKLEIRNAPIAFSDLTLIKELQGLENPIELNLVAIIGAIVGLVAVIVAIVFLVPRYKEFWVLKAAVFLVSVAFLYIFIAEKPVSPMKMVQFQNTWWRQELGTMRNGLYGNFVLLAKQNKINPPKGYSEQTIGKIGAKYKPSVPAAKGEKPNVIFLMSEAFIDPYSFGKQYFTEDPIPNFRKLFSESMHGTMYSPEFGGGTANVEFEALTGLSRQFMPDNTVAYQLYVKKPLPSVAYLFREAGYETTAIHSFYNWYYQRRPVYKNLGFNRFVPGEFMDLEHEMGTGHGYPEDTQTMKTILETLDYTEERDFLHVVSIEAHQPYPKIPDSKFLKKGLLPEETRQYLNNYTERIHNVDKKLGQLIEDLEKRNEPTILVFFGDHYPAFESNYRVYGNAGTKVAHNILGDYEDFMASHKVPYFIWNSEENKPSELDLTPNQFGAIALDMAGVQGNTVTAILDKMRSVGDSVIPYSKWQKQMGQQTKEMKDLRMLQYDLLHGKRYSNNAIDGLIDSPSKDYYLGLYKTMKLVSMEETGGKYKVVVKGAPKYSNLVEESSKEIETEWEDGGTGVAIFFVKKEDVDPDKTYRFIVEDSLGNNLRATKNFSLKNK
ncbi:hypothetical protein AM500_02320 [Bacillus sp. FJAT-18017]|uniref:LTA synthase family protein n=1 Tax=Bacillus sp. FJAT-18017 TaxID=1705566 RepID=UPI0006B03419|nr:LTA synthase family protein [Bacillus sp. FJAT-18017]ALC88763.1 hypothetical protein AM500_02320 [Bacillus sp. FJAT-18017]